MSDVRPTCAGTKANGEPCGTTLGLSPAGLCLSHDHERAAAAKAMRAEGGRAAGAARRAKREAADGLRPDDVPPPPRNLEDVTRYFSWVVDALATGRIDSRAAHELAYSLNGLKAAAYARDLEKETKALRKQVDDMKKLPRRVS